jgi:cytochrome P450
MWLGNQLFMVVSDPAIVKDLLVTNGGIFSSRKEMFIKSQIVFAGRGITATPYNDRWRKHRRIATWWLNQRAVDTYTPILDREAKDLVRTLYEASKGGSVPVNPQVHAGRCSLNNMTSITFGLRTDSIDHPLVGRALDLSREFMQVFPSVVLDDAIADDRINRNVTGPVSNLTDFVPLLQHNLNPLLRRAQRLHDSLVETYGGMIKEIDEKVDGGVAVDDCLAKSMLEAREKENLDDLDIAILASAFMIGGVETGKS